MSSTPAFLADRVASLLPKTTAGACVPQSPWRSGYISYVGDPCSPYCPTYCSFVRYCHYSCHGAPVCGTPIKGQCWIG